MKLTKFVAGQCRIIENDGNGLVCDESATVLLNDCILERNRDLTPKTNKRKKLESASLFPLIAQRQ